MNFLDKKFNDSSSNDKNNVVLIDLTDDTDKNSSNPHTLKKVGWLQEAKRCLAPAKLKSRTFAKSSTEDLSNTLKITECKPQPDEQKQQQKSVIVNESSSTGRSSSLEDTEDSSRAPTDSGVENERSESVSLPSVSPDLSSFVALNLSKVSSDNDKAIETVDQQQQPLLPPTESAPKPLAIVVPSVELKHHKSSAPTPVITSSFKSREPVSPSMQEVSSSVKQMGDELNSPNLNSSKEEASYDNVMDGLTLLAAVSQHLNERQQFRVKSSEELQQQQQAEIVTSTYSPVAKRPNDPQETAQQFSYILADRESLECNDNANVILNGETVVLLKKSPYSNLYIINKAVDEDGYLLDPEDVKLQIKSEDGIVKSATRQQTVKPDPDAELDAKPHAIPNYLPHQNCGCSACLSCCRQCSFLPQPQPAAPVPESPAANFRPLQEYDNKLPLKKRRLLGPDYAVAPSFQQNSIETPPDLGATVEVTTTTKKEPRRRANAAASKPRQTTAKKPAAPKKPRKSAADNVAALKVYEFVDTDWSPAEKAAPKKPRKNAKNSSVGVIKDRFDELNAEWNPSGVSKQRKRKRNAR